MVILSITQAKDKGPVPTSRITGLLSLAYKPISYVLKCHSLLNLIMQYIGLQVYKYPLIYFADSSLPANCIVCELGDAKGGGRSQYY